MGAAESLGRSLSSYGSSFFVTMQPDGGISFTFRFSTLPPSKAASATAEAILQRFVAEARFRADLLAWLRENGRLLQRTPEPVLEQAPLDETWTTLGSAAGSVVGKLAERFCRAEHEPTRAMPATPALASNR